MEQIAFAPAPQPKAAQSSASQSKSTSGSSRSDKQDFKTTFDNSLREQNQKPEEEITQVADKNQSNPHQDKTQEAEAATPNTETQQNSDVNTEEEALADETVDASDFQEKELPPGLSALMEKYDLSLSSTSDTSDTGTDTNGLGSQFARIPRQLLETLINQNSQKAQNGQTEESAKSAPQQQVSSVIANQDEKIMAMARQLDAIINGYQEKGTASITIERVADQTAVSVTPAVKPAIAIVDEMTTQAAVNAGSIQGNTETDSAKSLSRVAQMRLDATDHQGLGETMRVAVQSKQEQSTQQNSGENSQAMQSQSSSSLVQTNTVSSDQNINFAQTLNLQSTDAAQATATAKTATPFVHQQVNEQEVMQQVIQRFSVNPRLQTSKISMQLNPAELGEIKLDVLVKGDSIKASIVAQNQKVQDIIEKNMTKLRTILEEQGFTIDEIVVSSTNEDGSSFNLFQESFFQQDQHQQQTNNSSSVDFEIPIDEFLAETASAESGVNVKV